MTMLEKPEEKQNVGLVSVIIPVYNTKSFLRKCLDSVLEQSYSNLDVIVVDDGSTDGSHEILRQYASKDARIRVITQRNSGQSAARNTALDALLPETVFVTFLDSDDSLPSNAISSLKECLEQQEADMVCGLHDTVALDGTILRTSPKTIIGDANTITRAEMFELLAKHPISKYGYVWARLYRRHVFESVRFPVGKVYEDSICHRIYGACNRIAFLNEVVYHYLKRPGSVVNSGIDIRKFFQVDMFIDRIQYLRQEGFPEYSVYCLRQAFTRTREIMLALPKIDSTIRERVNGILHQLAIEYDLSSLSFLPIKERISFWANNHLFWPLYYRWKVRQILHR